MNNMKYKIYFLILIFLTNLFALSCNHASHTSFDRASEVKNYLEKVQNEKITSEHTFVFVLHNQTCGSCVTEVVAFILNTFKQVDGKKLFLLATNAKPLIKELSQLPNSSIKTDKDDMMNRYGLNYAVDFMLEYENENIIYWEYLEPKNIDKLKSRYLK